MKGQTRKITFEITVNSYWPEPSDRPILPAGGERKEKVIEFVQGTDKPMDEANKLLQAEMGSTPFHVWYWEWNK